jgi:ribosomal protein L4
LHGRTRRACRADSALLTPEEVENVLTSEEVENVLTSEEVENGLDNALVHEVKEAGQEDAGQVDLSGRDLPRVFGLLVKVANQTSGLLNAASIVLLLLCRHVDRFNPATSPL